MAVAARVRIALTNAAGRGGAKVISDESDQEKKRRISSIPCNPPVVRCCETMGGCCKMLEMLADVAKQGGLLQRGGGCEEYY